MSKRGQEPAYPVEMFVGPDEKPQGRQTSASSYWHEGMSTRLRIASGQMAALLANPTLIDQYKDIHDADLADGIAAGAFIYADALLAAEEASR